MIEQYYNISYKIDIVIHKKYLEDTESDALLHIVLSDPKHIKHALVTKAGHPSKKRNGAIYGDLK